MGLNNCVNTTSTMHVITNWTQLDILVFTTTCISRYIIVFSNESVLTQIRYSNRINDNRVHSTLKESLILLHMLNMKKYLELTM